MINTKICCSLIKSFLASATLLVFASSLFAQELNSLKLHSVGIKVSNVDQSLSFYQEVLGLPVRGRVGATVFLQIGSGTQFLSLSPVVGDEPPHITYIGLSAKSFAAEAFADTLTKAGFKSRDAAPTPDTARLDLANTYWINNNELYFVNLEGVQFQLTDTQRCSAGNSPMDCAKTEPRPGQGILSLQGINHFTTFVANAGRANQFFKDLFKLDYLSFQGPTTPSISIGDGLQFLMFVGGAQAGPPQNAARIHHVSFSVEDFNVDAIFAKLNNHGLTPRGDGVSTAPPLTYYVSLRMPNRGGAESGTPEVYFTDPDGVLLQVQDPSYCGGGGYLGDKC